MFKCKFHFCLGEEQIVGRIERREGPGDYVQNGERVKKEIKAENGHITRELTTYELEWQSDNEFDDDELKGLISDGVSYCSLYLNLLGSLFYFVFLVLE